MNGHFYRGFGILITPGMVYSGILIIRFAERTKKRESSGVVAEQGVFRVDRGCVEQIFVLKRLIENP